MVTRIEAVLAYKLGMGHWMFLFVRPEINFSKS